MKWLIYELALFITTKDQAEIPEKPYQIRLMEFFTKGIPAITILSTLQNFDFFITLYMYFSLHYDIITIMCAILYRFFFHSSKENDYKPILIKSGLLTPLEYVSLKEWFDTFLFNTKHVFSEPMIASSPRDFWSVRWQLMINEWFKELGYLPVRNLFVSFAPRRIANMMGVLGAFGVSALLHEYIIIGQYDLWTGEHFFFFMIHGVILILWEVIFGHENQNENSKIKRFIKWVLMVIINLSILPAFIQPLRRRPVF